MFGSTSRHVSENRGDSLRAGDVLGFSSHDCAGWWINLATLGVPTVGLSHIGIVAPHCDVGNDRLLLWESTSLYDVPCAVTGAVTHGLQAHHLAQRIRSYNGTVWAYRLRWPLNDSESWHLAQFCRSKIGRPYDFLGAVQSRETLLAKFRRWMLREEDLTSLFCSEFVADALRSVRRFSTRNASGWNPNALARELVRRGDAHKPRLVRVRGRRIIIED